jgi:hypothetical protein
MFLEKETGPPKGSQKNLLKDLLNEKRKASLRVEISGKQL